MFPSTQTTGTDDSPQLMHMTSVTLRTLDPPPASKPSSSEGTPFHKEKESSNVEGQETRERMAGDTGTRKGRG